MTTIAYKKGIICYDSRETGNGGRIYSDKGEKHHCINGIDFFTTGTTCDLQQLFDCYFGEVIDPKIKIEANALVWDNGKLFYIGVSDGMIYKTPLSLGEIAAIGSGEDLAMGAMEMGASAHKAVEIAIRRDANSGGEIHDFKL